MCVLSAERYEADIVIDIDIVLRPKKIRKG